MFFLALVSVSLLFCIFKASFQKEEDLGDLERFELVYVIDGDTIICKNDDHPEGIKVRYIGVDAPESVAKEEYLTRTHQENCEEGIIASKRNAQLLQDGIVYLGYDEERIDPYGRLLAYVYYYDDGLHMVQEVLLQEGLCSAVSIYPNVSYSPVFEALQKDAYIKGLGIWNRE